jgi:hypothetical protein
LVWLARPNTISPWARRRLHLNHHKYSGSEYDLEERGISNGMPWGLRRILVMSDQLMTVYLRPFQMFKMIRKFIEKQPEKERKTALFSQLTGFFPLSFVYYGIWYVFVIYHVVNGIAPMLGQSISWSVNLVKLIPTINFLAVFGLFRTLYALSAYNLSAQICIIMVILTHAMSLNKLRC